MEVKWGEIKKKLFFFFYLHFYFFFLLVLISSELFEFISNKKEKKNAGGVRGERKNLDECNGRCIEKKRDFFLLLSLTVYG